MYNYIYIYIYIYPPPRLARTAFLKFPRQASSLHSTYLPTGTSLSTVPSYLLRNLKTAAERGAPLPKNNKTINNSRSGAFWNVPTAMWKRPTLFGLICHRFLRPTCLQLGPNLASKIHQNRSKIDAKMHCILQSIF